MKLDANALNAVIAAARQLGEDEVTLPYDDGTITIRFTPKPMRGNGDPASPLTAGARMVARHFRPLSSPRLRASA